MEETFFIDVNDDAFLELFGALIGDGCITTYRPSKGTAIGYRIFITGNATTDLTYFRDFLCPAIESFGVHAYFRERKRTNIGNRNTIDIVINRKLFAKFLISLGFPLGKKGDLELPIWALSLPLEKQLVLLRGLFDTDGCLSARKSEKYRRPFALITSRSKKLRLQIKAILRTAGMPAYEQGHNVGVNGIKNTVAWFEKVGSNNPRNLDRYAQWRKTGILPMATYKNLSQQNNYANLGP